MPLNHLIGIGAGVVGKAGRSDVAMDIAQIMLLGGSYETVIGTDTRNCIGGRTAHVYGDDLKIVFGNSSLLGPMVGKMLDVFRGGFVSGDVRYNFGQQIDLVYGGPIAKITRGPVIQKTNFQTLDQPTKFSIGTFFKTAVKSRNVNRPKIPAPDVASGINPLAYNPVIDAKYEKPILATCMVLTAMTAASDFAMRFAYPSYDVALANQKVEPVPTGVRIGIRLLTNWVSGLIYHMELLSIHDNDATNTHSGILAALKQTMALTAAGKPTHLLKDIKDFLKRSKKMLEALIYNTIMIALVLVILGVILGLAVGASVGVSLL